MQYGRLCSVKNFTFILQSKYTLGAENVWLWSVTSPGLNVWALPRELFWCNCTFPTISHQVLILASAFSRHLNSAPPTLPSASVLWFRLSSLLSKIILIRVPPSLVRSPLPIYSHSNVNFPKWELDHVTPQLKTPGCSLKPPKIESSASCLCSHLPRPHFLSSPQIQRPAQLPPVCHIIYFCNCSLLGLESLSHPLGQS